MEMFCALIGVVVTQGHPLKKALSTGNLHVLVQMNKSPGKTIEERARLWLRRGSRGGLPAPACCPDPVRTVSTQRHAHGDPDPSLGLSR